MLHKPCFGSPRTPTYNAALSYQTTWNFWRQKAACDSGCAVHKSDPYSEMKRKTSHPTHTAIPPTLLLEEILLTDLSVVFNNKTCEVLFYDLVEDMFVGTVINKLLAVHNFSLEQKKKKKHWRAVVSII